MRDEVRKIERDGLAAVTAYVATRFGATVKYESPVWTLYAPSGRLYQGIRLEDAVADAALGEPATLPECEACVEPFSFRDPWKKTEDGRHFHAACLREAEDMARDGAWSLRRDFRG